MHKKGYNGSLAGHNHPCTAQILLKKGQAQKTTRQMLCAKETGSFLEGPKKMFHVRSVFLVSNVQAKPSQARIYKKRPCYHDAVCLDPLVSWGLDAIL